MSSPLPPYSTFRTDNKQLLYPQATSHGNILAFTPPGFSQTIQVKFPDKRLAVCGKCKKNYKTREACRERNGHTAEPWAVHYVCVTVDESCLDEEGKFLDKPYTVRMVQWQPFQVKDHFLREPDGKMVPVCASCKKTNRTRQFCREKHCHRQLPWCTVYVMMSALDATDPSTIVAGPSVPVGQPLEEPPSGGGKRGQEKAAKIIRAAAEQRAESARIKVAKDCDDINAVPESRTFLAIVSCQEISVKWVELADFDPNVTPETGVHSSVRSQQGAPATAVAAQAQAQANASAGAAGQGQAGAAGAGAGAGAGAAGANSHAAAYAQQPSTMQEYFNQLAAMGYSPQEQQQAWAAYMGMGAHAAHAQHAQYAQAQQAYAAQAQAYAQANGQHPGAHPAYAAHWGHMAPGAAYGHPGMPAAASPGGEGQGGDDGDSKPAAREAPAAGANPEETNGGEAKHDDQAAAANHPGAMAYYPHYQPDPNMDPAAAAAHAQWMQHNAHLYYQQMQMQPHDQDPNLQPNPLGGVPNEATAEDFDGLGVAGAPGPGDDEDLQHDAKRQRTDDSNGTEAV